MNDIKAGEDLAFIRNIMEQSRKSAALNGGSFVVWGILVTLGLAATWLTAIGVIHVGMLWIWGSVFVLGSAGTGWLVKRSKRCASTRGMPERWIDTIWMAYGISVALLFFVGFMSGSVSGASLSGTIALMAGTATYASGRIAGITWFRNLGVVWWAGAVALYLMPGIWTILVMGGLCFLLFVIPGLIFRRTPIAERA